MGPEHYYLDDTSFTGLLDNSANVVHDIRALVDIAEQILDEGQSISVPDSIETIQISGDLFFYDLYNVDFSQSDQPGDLDRDTLEIFLALKRRLDTISDSNPIRASLHELSGGCSRNECVSGAAEIIFRQKEAGGECFALLLVGSNGPVAGEYHLYIDGEPSNKIFVLRSSSDLPLYARWLIQDFSQSGDDFFSLWERAFPLLLRSNSLTFQRFDGAYKTLHNDVLKHLAFLNDGYSQLCCECNNDFNCIKSKAKSGYEVDFSNESVKTRGSKKKMKTRAAIFSNVEVICELHTKIRYNKNRIHFHPPVRAIGGKKVLIGIFVDHLET